MRKKPLLTGVVRREVRESFVAHAKERKLNNSEALEEAVVSWLRSEGVEVPAAQDEGDDPSQQ